MAIINQELSQRVRILIGHEIACDNIAPVCSLAVAGFRTSRGACGRIAVLGPTRMNYARVVSALECIGKVIEEIV